MLKLVIPASEKWDEVNEEFVYIKEQVLQLEHSLISVSKWEAKWHKPFISDKGMTRAETLDYIRCMTLTQNVPIETYAAITDAMIEKINAYIDNPMTATWFNKKDKKAGKRSTEAVTSELIYYWMISLGIPMECQKWHLNRLITLIKVCNIKNAPAKKMNKRDILSQNAAINKARREAFNSKG